MKTTISAIWVVLAFGAGLSIHAKPHTITNIRYVPVYQAARETHYFGEQRDRLAIAIPQSALRNVK